MSGYRRPRYGPSRDRILQATVATGDGRLVTAGGRVLGEVAPGRGSVESMGSIAADRVVAHRNAIVYTERKKRSSTVWWTG